MKKLMLITLCAAAAQSFAAGTANVYICTGPQSKRYHIRSDCRGLENCSKEIKCVTVAYAESIGRTPCGWCYKKK